MSSSELTLASRSIFDKHVGFGGGRDRRFLETARRDTLQGAATARARTMRASAGGVGRRRRQGQPALRQLVGRSRHLQRLHLRPPPREEPTIGFSVLGNFISYL